MIWFAYALTAAMLWGVSYALMEQLLKNYSMPFVMLSGGIASTIFALIYGLSTRGFTADFAVMRKLGKETGFLAATLVIGFCAHFFILLSIKGKNATMAAMIEITYPLFTAFFVWAFFREAQASTGMLMGALLIMAGVACIYFFDKPA